MSRATEFLRAIAMGDTQAAAGLQELIAGELRPAVIGYQPPEPPRRPPPLASLVHEAWLRLTGSEGLRLRTREPYLLAASRAMRGLLLENARQRPPVPAGGMRRTLVLDEVDVVLLFDGPALLALDAALNRLEALSPESAQLASVRLFAGLQPPEAAAVLGFSEATASRHWTYARMMVERDLRAGGFL